MIDINETVTGSWLYKEISVKKLIKITSKLEDEDILTPVGTGNMAILRNNIFIGFIDIGAEELALMEKK